MTHFAETQETEYSIWVLQVVTQPVFNGFYVKFDWSELKGLMGLKEPN